MCEIFDFSSTYKIECIQYIREKLCKKLHKLDNVENKGFSTH